jgi:hypothetical protein
MQSLLFLFLLPFLFLSCDNDDEKTIDSNAELLEKVVFYPESEQEVKWLFNENGLLSKITKANGTIIEEFIYDNNNNVKTDIIYNDDATFTTYTILYNSENIITKINETDYNYIASENKYFYLKGTEEFSCYINSDGLVTNSIHKNTSSNSEFLISYSLKYQNGNMMNYHFNGNNLSEVRNFNYNTANNPILKAALPVFKLKSVTNPGFFKDGFSSKNISQSLSFEENTPVYFNFAMLVYPNNSVEQLDVEVYKNDVFDNIYTLAKFYYHKNVSN